MSPEDDVPPVADADSAEQNAEQAFAAAGEAPPWDDHRLSASGEALTERPEAIVGAAFAGGVVFAMILKRLVR